MPIARRVARHSGAIYVEAAIVLPVLILVVFASIFFFLLAARHLSLQMLASEIARDVSLSLDPRSAVSYGTQGTCIQTSCTYITPVDFKKYDTKLDLTEVLRNRYKSDGTGCWDNCARSQYLLATRPKPSHSGAGSADALSIALTAYPSTQWFDSIPTGASSNNWASAGDYIEVTATYPASAVLGGGIAMFGAIPDIKLVGSAIAVLERPGSDAVEDTN